MRAQSLFRVKLVFLLTLAGLLLGACTGGGSTGATWFNLPSVTLRVADDGNTVNALGLAVGSLNSFGIKTTMDQLAAAGTRELEVRIGYNGIHIYNNGNELPYIYWDEDSAAALAGIITQVGPNMPDDLETAFAWLRKVGIGVRLVLADGRVNSRWSGETSYTPTSGGEPLAMLDLSGVAVDSAGAISVNGIGLDTLGVPPVVDTHTLQLLASLEAETLRIDTTPNTLDLTLNGQALPGLAYDEESLAAGLELAQALLADDPDTLELVNTFLPRLPELALTVQVSFTGTPVGSTSLPPMVISVDEAGMASAFGLPLGSDLLPADVLDLLQRADIKRLNLHVGSGDIAMAANNQLLPAITLHDAGVTLVDSLAGGSGLVPGVLTLLETMTTSGPVPIDLQLPGSDVSVDPLTNIAFAAPLDLESSPPILRLPLRLEGNRVASLGGLDAGALGLDAIVLPANVLDLLAGSSEVVVKTSPNQLALHLDGAPALSLAYDVATMNALLDLLPGLMGGALADNPALLEFIRTVLVPEIVRSDTEIVLRME